MAITFEKDLTGAETLEIMLKYPEHSRYLDNWPDIITETDSYNEFMIKINELEHQGYDWGKNPVRYVREYTEEQAVKMVRENPGAFKWFKNPTQAVRAAAGMDFSATDALLASPPRPSGMRASPDKP